MIADLKPYAEYKESGLPWLGQVPGHWEVRRTKAILREVDRRTTTGSEPLLSLRMQSGLVDHHAMGGKLIPAAALVGYKRVLPGEIVMNRMRAAAGLFAAATSDGLVSPDYAIFRPACQMSVAYAIQLFRTPAMTSVFRLESRGLGTGESGFLRLYSDRFGMLSVPFPSPAEQSAIVRFLDWANGRLERAIRAKRKVIALLNEQKQAIIHRAVTRGLDPSVPLKPSGIPWLGDIPQHWDVMPLRRLLETGRRITYGIVQPGDPHASGVLMVRGKDYSTGWVRQGIFRVSHEVERAYIRSRLRPGDIVITIVGAGVGNVALVPEWLEGANITQTTARISINATTAAPAFVLRVLQGPIGRRNLERYVYGAAQPRLNLPHVGAFEIPIPPRSEQLAIAAFLEEELEGFVTTATRLEREIELLREYRTRLVADVVTGKLDVREAAARLPDEPALDIVEDDTDLSHDPEAADDETAA